MAESSRRGNLPEAMSVTSGITFTSMKEKLDFYLNLAKTCMEEVHGLPTPKFNSEQCDYLVNKLKVTVESASLFLECSQVQHCESRELRNFELLVAFAKQIEQFIQGCSKETWMQSALTLANVPEYVSSMGFNLELFSIALSNGQATLGSLTMDEVCKINKDEEEIVMKKASIDKESLRRNATLGLNSKDCDLAKYLLHRLEEVQPKPTFDDDSIFLRFFEWVVPRTKIKQLGSGSSARVYEVMWLGTLVAKKTFRGPENNEFLKEVEILSQLYHPNITSMFCCQKNRQFCSIIMELMDGNLLDLIQHRLERDIDSYPFSILEGIDLMLQVGEGVAYLHDKHIVHRDLKSSNILIKNVEVFGLELGYVQAKVVDFGLSKTKEKSACSNMTYNTGTYRWMAPEVINNINGYAESSKASEKSSYYVFKVDIYSFAMVCYEILAGEVPFMSENSPSQIKNMVLKGERPKIPDYCPLMLKSLIEKCWSKIPTDRPHISDVCMQLKYIKYLLMTNSEDQTFVVHQLHPQLGGTPTSARATLIFFHGFHKAPQEWMTRDDKLVWPQEWLPEDLGAENIRVLSVAFDENTTLSNWHEIGKNLVNSLVLSLEWKLGESGEAIFLIGHSFGGVLIKSLVTEARHMVRDNTGQQEFLKCEKFLERLAKIVFYSVPHAEFENYISECRKIVALRESFFLQSLEGNPQFVADMIKLSSEFENAVPEKLQILAFLEGKAMSKESCVLVTEKSCEGAWEWLKIDDDDHFEVCRPNSKHHTGYRVLLEHLYRHLNDPYGVTSTLDSDNTRGLGNRQSDDLSKASEALVAKSLSVQAESSSGSAIFSTTPEHSILPDVNSNKPSDLSRGASRWIVIDDSTRRGKEDLFELPESVEVEVMGPSSHGDHYWELELKPKHNIYLSYSEAHKDFTEQLCVDLKRQQYHSFFAKPLRKGKVFRELIFRAAHQCNVAVLILSEDYFTLSKWPMIELELFVEVHKKNPKKLSILPVYLGVSEDECLENEERHSNRLSVWREWAHVDDRINVDKWEEALRVLGPLNGIEYLKSLGEVILREKIASAIEYLVSLHIQESAWISNNLELEHEPQIFLCHSGAQADFTEQLWVDLEKQQYRPFFAKGSLPAGRQFRELIFRAAQQCKVAVLILSEEFFTRSKWPMIELELFVKVQKKYSEKLSILPVYLEVTREECLKNEARRSYWLSMWKMWAKIDDAINVDKWEEALRVLGPLNGIEYVKSWGEVMFREKIVSAIEILIPREHN